MAILQLTNLCLSVTVNKNSSNLSFKGPFIFYEVGGAGGILGVTKIKKSLKGGLSKKIREKGGHVKYYLYWRRRGVVGKNLVTWGGHATF